MKKMIDADEKGKQRGFNFSGLSTEEGIFIKAHKNDVEEDDERLRRVLLEISYPGAFAYRDKDGTIRVMPEGMDEDDVISNRNKKNDEEMKVAKKIATGGLITAMVFLFLSFVTILIHPYVPYICFFVSFMALGIARIPMIVYCFVKSLFGDEEKRQCFRNHAAEHAVINAYYDLDRIPTLDEIRNYSSFSERCGIARKFRDAWVYFGIAFARLHPDLLGYAILLIAFFLFTMLWARKRNYFFTEIFALRKPTDSEYEVAIAAMTKAMEYKTELEKIDEDFGVSAKRILDALINGGDPDITFEVVFESDEGENIPR